MTNSSHSGAGGGPLTSASDKAVSRRQTEAKGWKLVWSDDFNYRGLPDSEKWDYEEGLVRNKELQFYTRRRLEKRARRKRDAGYRGAA
jgi:hypothetical protein